ncbi:uncharacterized protein [Anabrus simplex]
MEDDGGVECTTTPEWLDTNFLTTVVRQIEKDDDITVTSSRITYAVGKGDNYLSQMLRAKVKYTKSNGASADRDLIVKCLPMGEFMQTMMTESGTFKREIFTFYRVLPGMYKLVKEMTPQNAAPVSCLSYHCPQPNALVLEDLRPLGYKMANRRTQLDLEHCKVALRTLARFHGMSVALYKEDPSYIEEYKETTFSEETRDAARNVMYFPIKDLSEVVLKWPGYERFSEKLRNLSNTCIDKMIELLKPRPGTLRVLNHGDIWTNNILFKYSETTGEVIDCRLVDFQLCRFASPALDLQFFFYTTPQSEVRLKHYDDMLRVYHETLCDTLKSLGCEEDLISFQELQAEMEYNRLNGLIASCGILVIILADPEDAMDFSKLSSEDIGKVNLMNNAQNGARYQKVFKDLLLHFEEKGLL